MQLVASFGRQQEAVPAQQRNHPDEQHHVHDLRGELSAVLRETGGNRHSVV